MKGKIFLLTTTQETNKDYYTNETSTIIKLDDGNLVVINPVYINQLVANKISSLGNVAFVVANNSQNTSHFNEHKRFFPNSKTIGISPENNVKNLFLFIFILFFF